MFIRYSICLVIFCLSLQTWGADYCFPLWSLDSVPGKKDARAPVFTEITEDNIGQIFTYQYDSTRPELYGAKAVAFVEFGSRVDEARFFFFPSGHGFVANNVHHRDVLSQAYLASFESWASDLDDVLLRALSSLQDQSDATARALSAPERVGPVLEASYSLQQLAKNLKLRGQNRAYLKNDVAQVLIGQAQGYQFTAEYQKGRLMITRFEVDSSITSMQNDQQLPMDRKLQEALIDGIFSRIDPKVHSFKKPAWGE